MSLPKGEHQWSQADQDEQDDVTGHVGKDQRRAQREPQDQHKEDEEYRRSWNDLQEQADQRRVETCPATASTRGGEPAEGKAPTNILALTAPQTCIRITCVTPRESCNPKPIKYADATVSTTEETHSISPSFDLAQDRPLRSARPTGLPLTPPRAAVATMSPRVRAVRAYGPKPELNPTTQLDQVAD